MRLHVIQHVVNARPLIPSKTVEPELALVDWYKRIGQHLGWGINIVPGECIVTAPMQLSEGEDLLRRIQSAINNISAEPDDSLLLNLSSHTYCRHADWDRSNENGWDCLDRFKNVAIVFHSEASAKHADTLVDRYRQRQQQGGRFVVMDQRGNTYDLTQNGDKRRKLTPDLRQHIGVINPEEFQHRLLTESGRYFGHFRVPTGPHVRTHYDITPLISERSRAYEHIAARIDDIRKKAQCDFVIGFGMGQSGIELLCRQLTEDEVLTADYWTKQTQSTVLDHLGKHGGRALLVTDVLLTGTTASDLANVIAEAGGEAVGVLAVVGLQNSPNVLGGKLPVTYCAKLRRPFYSMEKPHSECPLCTLSGIQTLNVKYEEAFRKSMSREPTPYDFWELLGEANAFLLGHYISTNGNNHYFARAETAKVLVRYGDFVAGVLAEQVIKKIGRQTLQAIVCPSEEGALHLAYHMAKRLRISAGSVIGVDRKHLEMCPPSGPNRAIVESYQEKFFQCAGSKHPSVLVVDDGLNSTHSLMHMGSLLGGIAAKLAGYAVFINGSPAPPGDQLRGLLNVPILAFYRWGLGPFAKGKCPMVVCRTSS